MHNGSTVTLNTSSKTNIYSSVRSSNTLPRNISLKTSSLKSGASTPGGSRRRSFIVRRRNLNVIFIDGTCKSYEVDANQNGQLIFDLVCQDLFLEEPEYFGLKYTESSGVDRWLDLDKKISSQIKKSHPDIEFQVRYYPPSSDWFENDFTRFLLVQQVRQDILCRKLPSSQFMMAMLGAYVVQSEVGDFDEKAHPDITYLKSIKMAPTEYETKVFYEIVRKLHQLHKGTSREVADKKFLENARRMALYGVEIHEAKNDEGQKIHLGVGSTGVIKLKNSLRVNRFSWPMIVKFTVDGKQVSMHYNDPHPIDYTKRELSKDDINFELQKTIFNFTSAERAEAMYSSFVDHHSFFRLRNISSIHKRPKKPILISKFTALSRTSSPVENQYWTLEQGTSKNDLSRLNSSEAKVYPFYTHSFSRQSMTNLKDSTSSMIVDPRDDSSLNASSVNLYGAPKLNVDPGIFLRNRIKLIEDKIRSRYEFPPEKIHWNSSDCTPQIGFSQNELDIKALAENGGQGVRATCGVQGPGAYYYETRVMHGSIIRIGWTTVEGSLNLASDPFGFGYGYNVNRSVNNHLKSFMCSDMHSIEHGRTLETGDLIGCYLLLEADKEDSGKVKEGKCYWTLNGSVLNQANPDAHMRIPEELLDQHFYPTCSLLDARIMSLFLQKPTFDPLNRKIDWTPVGAVDQKKLQRESLRGWRLNPIDVIDESALSISPNGHIARTCKDSGWQGVRANKGVKISGKYHYEAKVLEKTNHVKIGWATEEASLLLGSDSLSYGFGSDKDVIMKQSGKIFHNKKSENYGDMFNKGDIIGCYLNLDQGIIHWSVNGNPFGEAYKIDKEMIEKNSFYPAISLKNTTVEVNFGEKSFSYPNKNGWSSLLWTKDQFISNTNKWAEMVKQRKTNRSDVLKKIRKTVLQEDRPESFDLDCKVVRNQTPVVQITDTTKVENGVKIEKSEGDSVKGKNPFDEDVPVSEIKVEKSGDEQEKASEETKQSKP